MKKLINIFLAIGLFAFFACSEETPEEKELNTPAEDNEEQVVDPGPEVTCEAEEEVVAEEDNTEVEEDAAPIVDDEEVDDEEVLEVE